MDDGGMCSCDTPLIATLNGGPPEVDAFTDNISFVRSMRCMLGFSFVVLHGVMYRPVNAECVPEAMPMKSVKS